MLEVLPIQSKAEQETVCKYCGADYNVDLMAYKAVSDGVIIGVCQFTMQSDGGHVKSLAAVEGTDVTSQARAEALFVMGRATLNFIDLCGVHTAYFEDDSFSDHAMISAIGFKRNEAGVWHMDLTDFFKHPCQHDCVGESSQK